MYIADVLALEETKEKDLIEEGKTYSFWHPSADYRRFIHKVEGGAKPLLTERLRNGALTGKTCTLIEMRDRVRSGLESLDQSYKRLLNPHIYKVSVTGQLRSLKIELIKSHLGDL